MLLLLLCLVAAVRYRQMLREDMEEIVAGKAVCPVRTVSKQDYPVRPLLSGLASSGPTKPTALEMKLCAKKLRSNKLRHRPLLGQSACDRRSSAVQRTGGLHPFNRPWDFGTGCRQPLQSKGWRPRVRQYLRGSWEAQSSSTVEIGDPDLVFSFRLTRSWPSKGSAQCTHTS